MGTRTGVVRVPGPRTARRIERARRRRAVRAVQITFVTVLLVPLSAQAARPELSASPTFEGAVYTGAAVELGFGAYGVLDSNGRAGSGRTVTGRITVRAPQSCWSGTGNCAGPDLQTTTFSVTTDAAGAFSVPSQTFTYAAPSPPTGCMDLVVTVDAAANNFTTNTPSDYTVCVFVEH